MIYAQSAFVESFLCLLPICSNSRVPLQGTRKSIPAQQLVAKRGPEGGSWQGRWWIGVYPNSFGWSFAGFVDWVGWLKRGSQTTSWYVLIIAVKSTFLYWLWFIQSHECSKVERTWMKYGSVTLLWDIMHGLDSMIGIGSETNARTRFQNTCYIFANCLYMCVYYLNIYIYKHL